MTEAYLAQVEEDARGWRCLMGRAVAPTVLELAAEVRRLRGWDSPAPDYDADGFVTPPARFRPPGEASA